MPVGAMLFLRHDVAVAKQTVERTYSTEQVNESMRLPSSELPYWTPGFPLAVPLEHGSRIKCIDCSATAAVKDEVANPIVSDTKELSWGLSEKKNGVVTIDTARSSGLVGFVKENKAETSHLSVELENEFCAVTLSALDDKPIVRAETMLLTTGGRVENSGQVWNSRRTNADVWGTGPTRIESVKGWVLIKGVEGAVGMDATALDGSARPIGAVQHARMLETGWEFPVGDVAATSYLIKVIR
jgi:hypothetical protein